MALITLSVIGAVALVSSLGIVSAKDVFGKKAEAEKARADAVREEALAERDKILQELPEETRASRTESKTDDFILVAKKVAPFILGIGAAIALVIGVVKFTGKK